MANHVFRVVPVALAGVSLVALLSAPARAQTAPAPAAPAAAAPEAPEVVITGTRIRNADFETANPVVSVNAPEARSIADAKSPRRKRRFHCPRLSDLCSAAFVRRRRKAARSPP